MTVTLGAIQGWGTKVQATMSSVATELEAAVPTGTFSSVLAKVSSVLAAGPGGAATSGATGSSGKVMTERAAVGGHVSGRAVVAEAERFLGTPYVWGGESPAGFDCSGLVQYVYGKLGVSVPRTSEAQAKAGTPVASLAQAMPGDLVFFAGSDGTATSPGHVGIYLGGGMMVDAPYTGSNVQVQPVADAGTVVAIRRIVGTSPSFAPTSAGLTSARLAPFGGMAPRSARGGPTAYGPTSPGPMSSVMVAGAAATAAGTTPSPSAGVPPGLAPIFVQAAGKYGLPVSLLTAVARRESNFNTSATSSAGAEGIMQLMPDTAAGLGVTPFTARQAINGAAQMLSGYLHAFGSVPLALAAYNAGAGAVERFNGVPPYAQTEAYVRDIMTTLQATG